MVTVPDLPADLPEMIHARSVEGPGFTDGYWKTFSDPQTQIPAQDLAKVLEMVRHHPPSTPLPKVDQLPPAEAVQAEDKYNLACIQYARQYLDM